MDSARFQPTLRKRIAVSSSKRKFAQATDSVAQIRCRSSFPFPRIDLSYGFRDRYAERGEAVHDGDTDLKFGDLTAGVPGHEALSEKLHAVHPGFSPTSAVVSAPFPPDRAAEVFRCPQRFVSCNRASGVWFRGPGAFRTGALKLAHIDNSGDLETACAAFLTALTEVAAP